MLGAPVYRLGDFVLDTRHQQLTRGDQRVELAKKPYQILVYLAENRDRLVTRQELIERFWYGSDVYDQTLSRTVARIRNALGDSLGDSRYIETRWATGYKYIGPFEAIKEPALDLPPVRQENLPHDLLASEASLPANGPSPSQIDRQNRPGYRFIPQLVLGFTVVAALAFGGVWVSHRAGRQNANADTPMTAATQAAKRKTVAVLTFRNQSGQERNDWLGTALAEIVSTDLAGDGRLRVVPGESVARAMTELTVRPAVGLSPETIGAVCRDLSTDFVVSGSYTLLDAGEHGGPLVRVDAMLQDAKGEVIATFADKGRYDDVFNIASAAKSRLIATLVLPGSPDSDRHDLALVTKDPEALKAYMGGMRLVHNEDLIQATVKLERAIQLDPSFALAHSALSDVWGSRGFQEKQKEEAGLALRLSSGLDREHVLLLKAKAAYAVGDWPAAIEAEQALFTFFPDNLEYGLELASAQTGAGRPHDADATLRLLRALPRPVSDDPRIDLAAASAAQAESNASAATRFTQNAMARAESSGARLLYARALSMQAGNLAGNDIRASIRKSDEARKICQEFEDDSCVANILRRLGVFLVDTNPRAAAGDFNQALLLARKIGNRTEEDNDLNGLATILSNQNDYALADKMYRQLLQNARSENSAWGVQMALNNLGNDLFMEGSLDEAERAEFDALHTAQAIGLRGATAYEELSLSQIRLARGDIPQAKVHAQAALTTFSDLHSDGGRASALAALGAAERFNRAGQKQAENHLREAIRMLESSGSIGGLAHARLELAWAELESEDARSAADLSRLAASGFSSQHSVADEASARGLLALALESLGEQATAAEELSKAQALVHATQARASELEVDFDTAAFRARAFSSYSGHDGTRALPAGAPGNTATLHSKREAYSDASSGFSSSTAGNANQATALSQLQKVALEARSSGFILLATRAQEMLDHLNQYASKNGAGFPSQ